MHGAVCQSHDELGCVDCSGVVREKSLQSAIRQYKEPAQRESRCSAKTHYTIYLFKIKKIII